MEFAVFPALRERPVEYHLEYRLCLVGWSYVRGSLNYGEFPNLKSLSLFKFAEFPKTFPRGDARLEVTPSSSLHNYSITALNHYFRHSTHLSVADPLKRCAAYFWRGVINQIPLLKCICLRNCLSHLDITRDDLSPPGRRSRNYA